MNYIAIARTSQVRINLGRRQVASTPIQLRAALLEPVVPPASEPTQLRPPVLFAPAQYRLSVSDRLVRAEALSDTVAAGAALMAVTDFQRQVLGAADTTAIRSVRVMYAKWRVGLPEDVVARLDRAMGLATGKDGGVRGFPPPPERVAWREAVRQAKREGLEERRYATISARWRRDLECVSRAERLAGLYAAHPEKRKMRVPEFQQYITDHYDRDRVITANWFKKFRDRLPEDIRDKLDDAMKTVTGKRGGICGPGDRGLEAVLLANARRPRKGTGEKRPSAALPSSALVRRTAQVRLTRPPRAALHLDVFDRPQDRQAILYRAMRGFLRAFRKISHHIANVEHGRQLGLERGRRYRQIDQDRLHRAQELAGQWEAEAALDPHKGFMRVSTFQLLILQGGDHEIVDRPVSLTRTFGLFTRRLPPEQRPLLDAAYFTCTGHHLGQTGHIRGQQIGRYRRRRSPLALTGG